jgi:hypothetical protein
MRSDAPTAGAPQIANSLSEISSSTERERDRFRVNVFETKNLQYFQRLAFGVE